MFYKKNVFDDRWTVKQRLKDQQLPTEGKIRFVPDEDYRPNVPLEKGPKYMEPKFDFFERVKINKILDDITERKKFIGRTGIVLTRSLEPKSVWRYLISIDGHDFVRRFREQELTSLGFFAKPEDHFVGETIKVGVTKDGKGYIKDSKQ